MTSPTCEVIGAGISWRRCLSSVCHWLALVGGLAVSNRVNAQSFPTRLAVSSPSTIAPTPVTAVGRRAPALGWTSPSDTSVRHRRAASIGGVVGAVLGGLGTAAYYLNATAFDCVTPVTIGPPCGYDPHTARRVVVITFGAAGGAALGAWIGREIGVLRSRSREKG